PCRLLEQGNYQYDGSNTIDAQQVKPPAVAEAEFRLTNDMFDISNMVGGPNGNKLAEQYRELVFSMIPTTRYVDIESASEMLLRAKENLRASVSRSIDDAEDIYPVVLTPANWAKYLSTNFKPQDLLNDASIMRNQLFDAEKTRATLLRRINVLKAGTQDLTKLQTTEDNARKDLTEAQNKMTVGYGDTVINLVHLYFDAALKGSENPVEAIKDILSEKVSELNSTLTGRKLSPLTPEQFGKLRDMQQGCLQRQASLNLASEAYMRARSASEQAKTETGGHLLDELQDQVDSLTMDIEYYQKVLATCPNPLADKITNVSTNATGASTWQDIVITYTASESADNSMSSSNISHESWQTGLWFFSAGGSKDSSSSEADKQHSTSNTNIKIGFRVMKVSINRPWVNTALLGQTKDFWRLTTSKISMEKPADVKKALDTRSLDAPGSEECIMPSWATSFVVAKDVHLIFSSNDEFDSSFVSNVQTNSNSGGGFLCFSTSKTESSTDHRDGASVIATTKSISVKIPAPQILGWICQLAPEDHTAGTYTKFGADEFPLPAAKPEDDGPVLRGAALPPTPPVTPPVPARA
ncbi:hypothetical protein N431DRAFT_320993, partial [Stipitochalara longipes BDJ]